MTSVDSGSISWREKNVNKYVKNCHMWITPTVQAAAAILRGVHKQWVLSLGSSWLCDSENRNHISSVPGGRQSDDVMRWLEMRLRQWSFCCPHWMPPCKCLIAEGFIWVLNRGSIGGSEEVTASLTGTLIEWFTGQFFSHPSMCCVNDRIWAPATDMHREQMLAPLKLFPGFVLGIDQAWSGK